MREQWFILIDVGLKTHPAMKINLELRPNFMQMTDLCGAHDLMKQNEHPGGHASKAGDIFFCSFVHNGL